jgi:terminase, large subunit
MQSQNLASLNEAWRQGWQLPARLNPWQWAEANIEFSSRVSPLPGKYSTTATPYVRGVLEAAADPKIRHITLCWSAQSSKTTTGMMILFYAIDNDPGNVLLVRPSLQAAKSLSENKIMPTINDNAALIKHKTSDRDDFQKTMIKLKNMVIFVRGANPNQLSAESCKIVFLDETDKYDQYGENSDEADLVSLAYERTKFYKNHLKLDTSTPTVPAGVIWKLFQEGSREVFVMPCPHCGSEFNFTMAQFRFDKDKPKRAAWFECPHCAEMVEEKHKPAMMLAGRWLAQNADATEDHRSFHLPEFYSPVTRWGELAQKFLDAQKKAKTGDFGPLHNFINSSLAEPWDPVENASREKSQLLALVADHHCGTVPDDAIGLTIGIDTQDLYFEYVIRAWGRDSLESWQVLHGRADSFADMRNILTSEFKSVGGEKTYRITAGLWDSGGHRTSEVYDFCRNNPGFRLRPSKGERVMQRPWDITKIDKLPNGNPLPGGVKLVRVNTTYYKDLLAGKLSLKVIDPGAFRLHADPDDDYLSHMTAEYRDSKGVWQCPASKRNESWDCEVLNLCCVDMLGLRFAAARGAATTKKQSDAPTEQQQSQPQPVSRKIPRAPRGPNPYTEGL